MKTYKTILLLLCAAFVSSCSKDAQKQEQFARQTLQVQCADSKVTLNDAVQTVWNAGDKVSVFFGNETNSVWSYDGADGATSGNIVYNNMLMRGDGPVYALWPSSNGATLSGSDISTQLPINQTLVEGKFGTAVLVAKTTGSSLQFKYASALLRVDVPGPITVAGITVSNHGSANIAGDITIDCSGATPVAIPGASGSASISLVPDSPIAIANGNTASFYVSLLPGTYTEGLEVAVTGASGVTHKGLIAPITLAGGQCGVVGIEHNDNLLIVDARFCTESGSWQNPFTVRPRGKSYPEQNVATGTETDPFYLTTDTGNLYPFVFCVSGDYLDVVSGTNGGRLRIGGVSGDYVKFPAVPGYKLKQLDVKVASSGRPFKVTDTAGAIVSGGEEITPPAAYYTHTFFFSGTAANTSYRLVITGNYQDFFYFTLKYEAV